jgi:hypothetical protein
MWDTFCKQLKDEDKVRPNNNGQFLHYVCEKHESRKGPMENTFLISINHEKTGREVRVWKVEVGLNREIKYVT